MHGAPAVASRGETREAIPCTTSVRVRGARSVLHVLAAHGLVTGLVEWRSWFVAQIRSTDTVIEQSVVARPRVGWESNVVWVYEKSAQLFRRISHGTGVPRNAGFGIDRQGNDHADRYACRLNRIPA